MPELNKLDKKDKKILYELDKNSRQPLSKIAKKVQLKRESVLYRIKKYFSSGLIRSYLTVIDMAKLEFVHYKIYAKLHNITKEQEAGLIKELCNNPFISWVSSCDGEFSLIFAIKARSVLELNEIIKKINAKYGRFFKTQEITTIINANYFYRDYLVARKGTTERKIEWGAETYQTKLDKLNIEILDSLCKNSRTSAVEIAFKLNISADAVIQRIKKLEKSGIIEHYMLWPNVTKLEGNYYKVLIKLNNLDSIKQKEVFTYCLNNPNIVYFVNCLGKWQFEIDIEVENMQRFRQIIRDFLNKFSEIVSDYTSLNIYDEHKYRLFEKDIFYINSKNKKNK